jgi:hypothetical protein
MAESRWHVSKVVQEHLQNLGYMIVAELAPSHLPEDPASLAPAVVYVVSCAVYYEWRFGVLSLLSVIKCIYLPPTYLHFSQDKEDRCLLLTSSTSFVDLPFQEHRMTEKHHMDQNPCISSLCPK